MEHLTFIHKKTRAVLNACNLSRNLQRHHISAAIISLTDSRLFQVQVKTATIVIASACESAFVANDYVTDSTFGRAKLVSNP